MHLPEILVVHFDEISIFPEIYYEIASMKVDTFSKNNGYSFSFFQFLLKLCYAVTSYKCQSHFLDKVAICIDEPLFANSFFYVAMSRIKCLDDIIFTGKNFPQNGLILLTNNEQKQDETCVFFSTPKNLKCSNTFGFRKSEGAKHQKV